MGSSSGDELSQWDVQSNGHDERIFVSVRLRPLNDREIARNDVSDWECINNSTIIYKNSIAERSMFPAAYTFGKQICRFSFGTNLFKLVLCIHIYVYQFVQTIHTKDMTRMEVFYESADKKGACFAFESHKFFFCAVILTSVKVFKTKLRFEQSV